MTLQSLFGQYQARVWSLTTKNNLHLIIWLSSQTDWPCSERQHWHSYHIFLYLYTVSLCRRVFILFQKFPFMFLTGSGTCLALEFNGVRVFLYVTLSLLYFVLLSPFRTLFLYFHFHKHSSVFVIFSFCRTYNSFKISTLTIQRKVFNLIRLVKLRRMFCAPEPSLKYVCDGYAFDDTVEFQFMMLYFDIMLRLHI